MNKERRAIQREQSSQGAHWGTVHHGYFGDEAVARPLVEAVVAAMDGSRPSVLADLGGGTGFLLSQILKSHACDGTRLLNVDLSARQLAECHEPRLLPLQASASHITRDDLEVGEGRLMLMMRSVLHYFGCEGCLRVLRHLRAQMSPGELFVHQTASFWLAPHRRCINLLYQRMATGKWYPLVGELQYLLNKAGWETAAVAPAPPLMLDSPSLAARYDLDETTVRALRDELVEDFGPVQHVFEPQGTGFTAWLHYHVFTCRAV